MMIDWLKLRFLIDAQHKLPGDYVMIADGATGEIKWTKQRATEVVGSHDGSMRVYPCPVTGQLIIDCNPSKFLQGHNLFGSTDIIGLSIALFERACLAVGLTDITDGQLDMIHQGFFEVARLDITGMYSVGSLENARAAVRALSVNATMHRRGRGEIGKEGTVYWGMNSRRSALKAYAKGHELKDHPIKINVPYSEQLTQWAQDKLRIEAVYRTMELKDRGLNLAVNWKPETVTMLFTEALGKLRVSSNIELAPTMIDGLKPRHRLVYAAWLRGEDLRATLPKPTFYRYRAELLEHGVDILTVRPSEPRKPTLQLVNIINAVPASVPEWAIGTSAYFEPPARRVA